MMLKLPVCVPEEFGAKATLMVQLVPDVAREVQVLPVTTNGPVIDGLAKVTVAPPVSVTVTVFELLVLPTLTLPKLRLVGETLTVAEPEVDEAPVPERGIDCGLFVALSEIVTVPVRVPVAVGVKLTLMVQFAPAATVLPQVPVPPKAKSPLIVRLLMVSEALPVLVRVTVLAALVVLTV